MIEAIVGVSKDTPYYRRGYWWPVFATVHNAGHDFRGRVTVSPDKAALKKGKGYYVTRFHREVDLPKGTTKRVPVPVFFAEHITGWQVDVVSDRGAPLLPISLPVIGTRAGEEALVLVVAERRGAERFMRQEGSQHSYEKPFLKGRRPVLAERERVPSDWLLMSGYDCIVVDNLPAGFLDNAQLSALAEYCLQGGCLVVAADSNALWLSRSPLARALPVKPREIVNRDVATALAGQLGWVAEERRSMATAAVDLLEGTVVASCQGDPLIVRAQKGRGVVTFVSFSLSNPLTESWHNKQLVADVLIQPKWISALDPASDQAPSSGGRGSTAATTPRAEVLASAESKPLAKFPDYRGVAALLVVYLAVLSPLTYLTFRKMDRPEWAWRVCPVVALVFAAIPYAAEMGKPGRAASVSELRLIETSVGQSTGLATSLFVAYSPTAAECDITFEDGTPLVTDFHAASPKAERLGSPGLDVALGAKTTISDLSILRQSVRSFGSQSTVDLGRGIHVRAEDRGRTWLSLANGLGFDLDNVYLFDPRMKRAAHIGHLPFAARRAIPLQWGSWRNAISVMASGEEGSDGLGKLLQVAIHALRRRRDRAVLVGCCEELTRLAISGKTVPVVGATLVVVQMPRRLLSAERAGNPISKR